MMRISFFLAFQLLFACPLIASDKPDYAAAKIKNGLSYQANAVIRRHTQEITVMGPGTLIIKSHYVITILGKAGVDYGLCSGAYSGLSKLEKISANVYDKNGAHKMKILESDFFMAKTNVHPAAYDDWKVKMFRPSYSEYPYTVELFTTSRQLHSFTMPSWIVRPEYDIAVENSSYIIHAPGDFALGYKSVNARLEPVTSQDDQGMTYTWTVRDIYADQKEHLTDDEYYGSPVLLVSPSKFQLGTHTGSNESWKSFGTFVYELNKDRDQLTESKAAEVRELVSGIADPVGRVTALYRHLQKTTRYVSIQYGIGGWQTLDARFVSENQYGDCKALSNYMQAMLKVAGISSYAVIVSAGKGGYQKMPLDIALPAFNHMVLAVPLAEDTIWLECTSRDLPAGYLGSFTADRDALMITPDGGVVVHTPKYGGSANVISRSAKAKCNEDGSISSVMQSRYSGIPAESLLQWSSLNDQEREQYVNSRFARSGYTANNYGLNRSDEKGLLVLHEQVSLKAQHMVSKAGGYQLVSLDLAPLPVSFEEPAAERKRPFYLRTSLEIVDTVELVMPDQVTVSSLPKPVEAASSFGHYRLLVKQEGDRLFAYRSFILNEGNYEAARFADFIAWMDNIQNSRHYQVILAAKP